MLEGWSRIEIGGKPADVFDPPDGRFALLYLHALNGETPATSPVFTAQLRAHRLRCVAPHGGPCWWTDRVCPEFDPDLTSERHLLDNIVPWIESAWLPGARGIAVTGIEMGGHGALRLAFKHPTRFPVAAGISGALDMQEWFGTGTPLDEMYSTREQCRQDTAILHLDDRDWPPHIWFCCEPTDALCYRGNDRLHEKLAAMGVPHTADLDTRGALGALYANQMTPPVLSFITAGLEKETRRLM